VVNSHRCRLNLYSFELHSKIHHLCGVLGGWVWWAVLGLVFLARLFVGVVGGSLRRRRPSAIQIMRSIHRSLKSRATHAEENNMCAKIWRESEILHHNMANLTLQTVPKTPLNFLQQ